MFKKIFLDVLSKCKRGNLIIRENGKEYTFGGEKGDPAIIEINHPDVFKSTVMQGDVGFGESYMVKHWDTPNLVKVLSWFIKNRTYLPGFANSDTYFRNLFNKVFGAYQRWSENRKTKNTFSLSKENISYHYDLSNDFFKLMLDKTMAYSSAYFKSPKESLYQGQINKFENICKNLKLNKNDHLLEIGSGWGGFAVYAAKKYGCKVTTLTLSNEQYNYVQGLIKKEKLTGKVEVKITDYRKAEGMYDKIVSIEMIEAIGYPQLDTFCKKCTDFLKERGIMVIQMITFHDYAFHTYVKNTNWIQKHIFPGSHLLSIVEFLNSMRKFGQLTVLKIESIGQSYARTLDIWAKNCMLNKEKIKSMGFDEVFFRKWIYYLVSCEVAFRLNYINDVQITLVNQKGMP